MTLFRGGPAGRRSLLCRLGLAAALVTAGPLPANAGTDGFEGPSFRKGLWHFVRTIDLVLSQKTRQRVMEREMTRCVDPTAAMKGTFSSGGIGSCVSDRARKSGNRYTFAHRCDYMGPVSTVITVHGEDSYTELNEMTVGNIPRTELVVAHRVGDCRGDTRSADAYSSR